MWCDGSGLGSVIQINHLFKNSIKFRLITSKDQSRGQEGGGTWSPRTGSWLTCNFVVDWPEQRTRGVTGVHNIRAMHVRLDMRGVRTVLGFKIGYDEWVKWGRLGSWCLGRWPIHALVVGVLIIMRSLSTCFGVELGLWQKVLDSHYQNTALNWCDNNHWAQFLFILESFI